MEYRYMNDSQTCIGCVESFYDEKDYANPTCRECIRSDKYYQPIYKLYSISPTGECTIIKQKGDKRKWTLENTCT